MRAYYCDHFVLPLPATHSFPMAKYRLLRERIAHALGLGICLHEPPAASLADLLRVHCPRYVDRVLYAGLGHSEQRRLGLPWSPALAARARRVSGATIAALRAALDDGIAVSLAGGTHHAHYDRGAGYCVFNDSVVAARHVQAECGVRRVLVVDLDVHQGDGTAALTLDDPSIYTFSMHAARNYPAVKCPSKLDVALADGTGDDAYLEQLARHLPHAIADARADCALYLAGADPYRHDRLGLLALSQAGLRARDRYTLDTLRAAGLPVAVTMAGGYAEVLTDLVEIHLATVLEAVRHGQ